MTERVLAFSRVSAEGQTPTRWMILLHGIFGSGGNLRTLARRLATKQPDWGFVLPDLRAHGGSLGLPPPDTFEEAAADVERLAAALDHPVHGLAGHSFGGKVALRVLGRGTMSLERFVLLDSAPGSDPTRMVRDQAGQILSLLEKVDRPIRSREAFIDAIVSAGHGRAIAEWLAMQVRRATQVSADVVEYELRLDLPAIRHMLEGYFATDLWSTLEDPQPGVRMLVVVGGRSTVVNEADRARLRAAATREPRMEVSVLERAGHWLHADDLEGLVEVVAPRLALG